jgi:Ala-tRNA(Pro) deacylase
MPTERLKKFLDERGVPYETIQHTTAYTAQGVAASIHISGRELAKTTVVKLGDTFALAVLPAPMRVDTDALGRMAGARTARLATESEFQGLFPGCEVGAMPPFGNLYDLPVWVEEALTRDESIVFNAGTHREAMRIAFADFERLVKPKVASFAVH